MVQADHRCEKPWRQLNLGVSPMRKVGVILILMFAGSASTVAAQDADPCATQSNTMEINSCAQKKFDASDHELNQAYQRVLRQLPSDEQTGQSGETTKKLLIAAQRKWMEFRDADCKAQEHLFQGGSIHTAVHLECLREHSEQRIKELNPTSWQGG